MVSKVVHPRLPWPRSPLVIISATGACPRSDRGWQTATGGRRQERSRSDGFSAFGRLDRNSFGHFQAISLFISRSPFKLVLRQSGRFMPGGKGGSCIRLRSCIWAWRPFKATVWPGRRGVRLPQSRTAGQQLLFRLQKMLTRRSRSDFLLSVGHMFLAFVRLYISARKLKPGSALFSVHHYSM